MSKPVAIVPELVRTNVVANVTLSVVDGASCLAHITDSGTARLTITTQPGGTFSGGQLQFATDTGRTVVITFNGSVSTTGALTGPAAINISGGGVSGSGAGTFTGTASQGLSGPGSLSLTINGTASITGAGTCAASAQIDFIGS